MKRYLVFVLTMIIILGSITTVFADGGNGNGNGKPLNEVALEMANKYKTTPIKIDDTTYFIKAPIGDSAELANNRTMTSSATVDTELASNGAVISSAIVDTGYILKRLVPYNDPTFYVDQQVGVKVVYEYGVYRFLECYGSEIFPGGSGTFSVASGVPITTISDGGRYLTAQNSGQVTGVIYPSVSANFLFMGFTVGTGYNVVKNIFVEYTYDGDYIGAILH